MMNLSQEKFIKTQLVKFFIGVKIKFSNLQIIEENKTATATIVKAIYQNKNIEITMSIYR